MSQESHSISKMCSMPIIKRRLRPVQHFNVKMNTGEAFKTTADAILISADLIVKYSPKELFY